MKSLVTFAVLLFSSIMFGQAPATERPNPLDALLQSKIEKFEIKDDSLLDGLSELSLKSIPGLHLGIEEIPRNKITDARDRSVLFSLKLEGKTLQEILDSLCRADARYTWSKDGLSINVYPRESNTATPNLLERSLDEIALIGIPDPDQALTPLSKLLPQEQIGYMQMGGENAYAEPWTITLRHVTVRQFTNRIAEHIGSQTSWIWQGGRDEKMFTFLKGGFHT